MSAPYVALVLALGLGGYYIFRAVNDQKDKVRASGGNIKVWGKPAKVIRTEYTTSDGKVHKSILLISGYWGKLSWAIGTCGLRKQVTMPHPTRAVTSLQLCR